MISLLRGVSALYVSCVYIISSRRTMFALLWGHVLAAFALIVGEDG